MNDDKQDQDLLRQKKVAFYSKLVQAWISTRMEKDRTLLAISSVGIGALITLLTAFDINSYWEIIPYGVAALAFLSVIVILIIVLEKNADYIRLLKDDREREKEKSKTSKEKIDREEKLINRLDRCAFSIFFIGLIFTIIVLFLSTVNNIQIRSTDMDEEKSDMPSQQSGQTQTEEKGLGGLGNLEPGLGGLGGLGDLDSQDSSDTQEGEGTSTSESNTSGESEGSSD